MRKGGVCHYFNYFCKRMLMVGRRTESDRTADAIQSDGGRNLIGRRTESDRTADANDHSM